MTSTITAALLVIGNEVLSGRTQDKNIAFLATHLGAIGINLKEVRIIPDHHHTIITTVNELRTHFTYVFTTGGIGPTHDDITSEAIASAFNVPLILHEDAVARLKAYYKDSPLNEARLKMAKVPQGAILIDNPVSSAPGYRIENVYVLAGVPKIMQAMYFTLEPELTRGSVTHSYELTAYVSESKIAASLAAIQNQYPLVEIGSYPFTTDTHYGTNIVLRSVDRTLLEQAREKIAHMLDTSL